MRPCSRTVSAFLVFILFSIVLIGCGGGGTSTKEPQVTDFTTVNSLDDMDSPPAGTVTLRMALSNATTQKISFASSLDGGTIQLRVVGEAHTMLKGEVYNGMTFMGYQDRDYGKSALYARKDVTIDASNLPHGITIHWAGGDTNPARVLAVYGNLTMANVTISGGVSNADALTDGTFTLARGGGLAVWGNAVLDKCTIAGNKIIGDANATRDRGAYGGGIYANGLQMMNTVVSGNTASGYGAAGGGIYSVGGADNVNAFNAGNDTWLTNCVITGNRVTAQHAYGGGVFTLSGGPINLATMRITNCTIARNLVEDNPDLPNAGQYYYRGGGVYMGGGSLSVASSTIAENEVRGVPAIISGKPNEGGGGIAATIGDAHVIENLIIRHSIIAGNKLDGAPADVFTGSLLNFYSLGYNLVGSLDFSQILVPVSDWTNLSRKHYPKVGDHDGVQPADVLALTALQLHPTVVSAGTDAGQPAVLSYPPIGAALDKIPIAPYNVVALNRGYTGFGTSTDDFLNHALVQIRTTYGSVLGSDFGSDFPDMTGVTFYGPSRTWPSNSQNAAWIQFWHDVDTKIAGRLGYVGLNDDFWGTFPNGPLGAVTMRSTTDTFSVTLVSTDQRGIARPVNSLGDIGAIEH